MNHGDERQGLEFVMHSKSLNTSVSEPKDISARKRFGQAPPVWSICLCEPKIDEFAKNRCRYVHRFAPRVEIRKRKGIASCTKQPFKQPHRYSPPLLRRLCPTT